MTELAGSPLTLSCATKLNNMHLVGVQQTRDYEANKFLLELIVNSENSVTVNIPICILKINYCYLQPITFDLIRKCLVSE